MMMRRNESKVLMSVFALLAALATTVLFQNCAPENFRKGMSSGNGDGGLSIDPRDGGGIGDGGTGGSDGAPPKQGDVQQPTPTFLDTFKCTGVTEFGNTLKIYVMPVAGTLGVTASLGENGSVRESSYAISSTGLTYLGSDGPGDSFVLVLSGAKLPAQAEVNVTVKGSTPQHAKSLKCVK